MAKTRPTTIHNYIPKPLLIGVWGVVLVLWGIIVSLMLISAVQSAHGAEIQIVSESGTTPYAVVDVDGNVLSRHQREDKAIESAIKLGGTHWIIKDGRLRVQVTETEPPTTEPPVTEPPDPPVIEPSPATIPEGSVKADDYSSLNDAIRSGAPGVVLTGGKTYKLNGELPQSKSGFVLLSVNGRAKVDTNGCGGLKLGNGQKNVTVYGIDWYTSNPARPSSSGKIWGETGIHIQNADGVLIEDCSFDGYFINVRLEGANPANVTLRNSRILNANTPSVMGAKWSVGLYASHPTNLLVEGCYFDHNGYLYDGKTPSGFSQQTYTYAPRGLTFRNNTFVRSGFLAIKVRADKADEGSRDITIEGNVFTSGTLLPIGVGSDEGPQAEHDKILHARVKIKNNLIVGSGGTLPNDNSEHGNGINVSQVTDCEIDGNLLIDQHVADRPAISLEYPKREHGAVAATNNIVHRWRGSISSINGAGNLINKDDSYYTDALGVDDLELDKGAGVNIQKFKAGYVAK